MRVDLVVPNEGSISLEAVKSCPAYEAMGYDGLWFTDHVVGQRAFTYYSGYWLEIMSVLSYVAGVTSRVRLGTGILVVPYRDPVMAAKQLSTIDQLSGGRLDLGIGTGWAKGEFYALGRGDLFKERGAYTNEALDVMLRCWQGGEFDYEGRWINFRHVEFDPTPVQKPRIPLWIGALGTAKAPMERAAKYADVWHPGMLTPTELKQGSEQLNELAGREIRLSSRKRYPADMPAEEVIDDLQTFREVGCFQMAIEVYADSHSDFMSAVENIAALLPTLKD